MQQYTSSLVAQTVKRLSTMWETQVRSLGWEDPLEKEMAIHSRTIAWKIPWTEESVRLQPMGSQRVGHDWATSLSLSGREDARDRETDREGSWELRHTSDSPPETKIPKRVLLRSLELQQIEKNFYSNFFKYGHIPNFSVPSATILFKAIMSWPEWTLYNSLHFSLHLT